MNWYVGVDGGGTKTDVAVSRADGVPAATLRLAGCSYQTIGIDCAVQLVADGVHQCLALVDAGLEECAGCCIGTPCYGENPESDRAMEAGMKAALAPVPVCLVNDVEVGWAGALECREGIHLVAGTGSIAFGCGSDHKTARCGGWNEFFGDEGSCYWVGRETMSLFSKQCDGRVPRGVLYDLVRRGLGLARDSDFTEVVMGEIAPHRERVAQFQQYACQAAERGDTQVAALYERAADELAQMAGTLKNTLTFSPGRTKVSYSGGLFKARELVLQPLREKMEALDCELQAPRHSPVEGALMLAIQQFKGRN